MQVEVALGHAVDAELRVVGDDALLHVGHIGRHQAERARAAQREDLVEREHRSRGRDAGGFGDACAQALVGIEAEPAGGGAAPADHVDTGVGQQPGRVEDLAVVELAQRSIAQRDLGDGEAREVGRGAGHLADHRAGQRLQRGVGGGRENADQFA